MADIGKISCTPKGTWDATENYDVLDIVRDGTGIFIAKSPVPVGTPTSNTTYWMLMVQDGDLTADNTGTAGDFAVNNGAGGIHWTTVPNASGVNF